MSINFNDHDLTTSGIITAASGYFTTLTINNSNFNSSVSGLLPTIANSGDNRVLTSTGSTVGINAESNLIFNDETLFIGDYTGDTGGKIVLYNGNAGDGLPSITFIDNNGNHNFKIYMDDSDNKNYIKADNDHDLIISGSNNNSITLDNFNGKINIVSSGVTISSSGTNVPLTITNDGTGNSFVVNDTTGDTSPFVIDNAGNVGIGTDQPKTNIGKSLHMYNDANTGTVASNSYVAIQSVNRNSVIELCGSASAINALNFSTSLGTSLAGVCSDIANQAIFFRTGGSSERMRITSDGNVGIGTTSPTLNTNGTVLHIHNSTASRASIIRFTNNESGSTATDGLMVGKWSDGTNYIYDYDNYDLILGAHNGNKVRIHSVGTSFYQSANGTPSLGSKNFYAATFENLSAGYGLAIGGVNASTGDTSIQVQNFTTSNAYNLILQPLGGKVGIGVTPASAGSSALQVRGDLDIFGNGSDRSITYNMGVGDDGITGWYRSKIAFIPSSATNKISQHIAFFNKDGDLGGSTLTERMRIATDGNVGIGTSSPQARLHVSSTNDGVQAIFTGAQTANTQSILFRSAYHTNNGTAGFANIGWIDNASQGGHLTFGTTSSNSGTTGTPTERMRITSAGDIGIGTSSVSSGFKVDIRGRVLSYTTASDGLITVQGLQTASAGTGKSAIQIDVNGNGGFAWQNDASSGTRILKLLENSGYGSGDSELIRVLSGGDVLIGTTTDQGSFKLQVANNAWMDNLYLSTTTNWGRLSIGHNGATTFAAGFNNTDTSSTGQTTVNILRNGTSVGSISTTNAATSYNTNSDYRLKNNVINMVGASQRLLLLRPVTFEWKVGGSGEGFIAHELAEAVPLAVTGEKDAKDSYGMPIMQSVDHSKLVPLLVAALQEAYAEIANIKSRLSSLEQK